MTENNEKNEEKTKDQEKMVYGPGRYKFFDIARYGVGLTFIMTLTVPALIILNFN